jgi:hypothetical protein
MFKITLVPLALKAKTTNELTNLMLQNNLKYHKNFHYFDIQKDGNTWVAWYMQDISEVVNAPKS